MFKKLFALLVVLSMLFTMMSMPISAASNGLFDDDDIIGDGWACNHKWIQIPAVDATCTESGSTAGEKCLFCGEVRVAPTTVNPTGHTVVVDAGKDATSPSDSTSLISETTSGGKPAAKPGVGGSSKSGAAGVRDACYATTKCGARNALKKLDRGDQMALAVLVGGGLALSPVGQVVAGAMMVPGAAGLVAAGLGVGGGVLALIIMVKKRQQN